MHFLEKKYNKISTESANKNDIIQLLGPPSTKSLTAPDDSTANLIAAKVSKLGKKELLRLPIFGYFYRQKNQSSSDCS